MNTPRQRRHRVTVGQSGVELPHSKEADGTAVLIRLRGATSVCYNFMKFVGLSMRLSWNEIRVRAARFADEWKHAHYEKGESQTFYNEFFEIFGVTRRRVANFEEPVKRLG